MKNELLPVAQRIFKAEDNFIEVLMGFGKIDKAQAQKVFATYLRLKVIKRDLVNLTYKVNHGAFLEKDVIERALSL